MQIQPKIQKKYWIVPDKTGYNMVYIYIYIDVIYSTKMHQVKRIVKPSLCHHEVQAKLPGPMSARSEVGPPNGDVGIPVGMGLKDMDGNLLRNYCSHGH